MKSFEEMALQELKVTMKDVLKAFKKSSEVSKASINHDGTCDITTKHTLKDWEKGAEAEDFGVLLNNLGVYVKHAYKGLAGKSYEMDFK